MKYRHSFHAGNFADVHKHVALCALLRAMQRKHKGFFYLDTHAGAGRYDLDSPDTHRGAEARHGVTALMAAAAPLQAEELQSYCAAIEALRAQGAADIEQAQGEWRDGDWADFNPVAAPRLVESASD